MKKRFRKKKLRGEFTERGRQLIVTRNRKDEFGKFLDAFIEKAIEANGLGRLGSPIAASAVHRILATRGLPV
jgi:uncharacterized protein YggL (DUF469 family)